MKINLGGLAFINGHLPLCNNMFNNPFISPLRYPGGKAKISRYIRQVIHENSLQGGVYVEPYAGGASVALDLLLNGDVETIVINDKDRSIYAFWYCVINHTEELCRMINDTVVSLDEWEMQRLVQVRKDSAELLELGFSTFFLNRTNRSGILKGGVIGGRKQDGKYKIDARFNKADLIKRIDRIACYKTRINLYNTDAVELIKSLNSENQIKTLIYFDPPYYVKGSGLYLNYYKDKDHEQIAELVYGLHNYKWLMSYDNVLFIQNLYREYRTKVFELSYSASNSGKGQEIMIYSDNIIIPECEIINKAKR